MRGLTGIILALLGIRQIQYITATIAASSSSQTASITSVNTSKTVILPIGATKSDVVGMQGHRWELTNATTATVHSGIAVSGSSLLCYAVVIEWRW